MFGLVLDTLKRFESGVVARRKSKFLAPEAGLGRPAWGFCNPIHSPVVRSHSGCTVLTYLARIRYDGKRAFTPHEPRTRAPAPSPNDARVGQPLRPLIHRWSHRQSMSLTFRPVLSSHGSRIHCHQVEGDPSTRSLGALPSSRCSS